MSKDRLDLSHHNFPPRHFVKDQDLVVFFCPYSHLVSRVTITSADSCPFLGRVATSGVSPPSRTGPFPQQVSRENDVHFPDTRVRGLIVLTPELFPDPVSYASYLASRAFTPSVHHPGRSPTGRPRQRASRVAHLTSGKKPACRAGRSGSPFPHEHR